MERHCWEKIQVELMENLTKVREDYVPNDISSFLNIRGSSRLYIYDSRFRIICSSWARAAILVGGVCSDSIVPGRGSASPPAGKEDSGVPCSWPFCASRLRGRWGFTRARCPLSPFSRP